MNTIGIEDFGKKIIGTMQDVLEREMRLAQVILDPQECVLLMSKIAAGITGAAILVALQIRKDDTNPDEVYEHFADAIRLQVSGLKPIYLRALREIEAGRTPA